MTSIVRALCVVLLSLGLLAAANAAPTKPILGDAGNELRTADGRVDVDRTLDRVAAMHANTFFYQIWHGDDDWAQLPEFADKARARGIDVWVYLVPWSEGKPHKHSGRDSQPFKQDFVRWATEIATLSKAHPNIVGWTIDDFGNNDRPEQTDRFTPDYVTRMRDASRAINPSLQFWPVLYAQQDWADFITRFGTLVDGAIVCYPRSEAEVDDVLGYLRGSARGPGALFVIEGKTRAGEGAAMEATLTRDEASTARELHIFVDDQISTKSDSSHEIFVSVSGKAVWSRSLRDEGMDRHVVVRLPEGLREGDVLRIGVRCADAEKRELDQVRFSNVQLRKAGGEQLPAPEWRDVDSIGIDATLSRGIEASDVRLPMLLMPAGLPYEHEKRYQEPGTPEAIAKKLGLCERLIGDGRAVGMVTWYAPLDDAGADVRAVITASFERLIARPRR